MDSKIITDNYGERITEIQSLNTFSLVRQPKEPDKASVVILNIREAEEIEKDLKAWIEKAKFLQMWG